MSIAIYDILSENGYSEKRTIVEANFGTQTFYDEFQGVQWDRLMVMLKHCKLVSFTEFDDDATRLFIN